MDINGLWKGTLVYGKEYGVNQGKELVFDMDIVQKGDEFEAKSSDIEGFGKSNDKALIKGALENNKINFLKQYDTYHYYHKQQHKVDKRRKGHIIHYTGIYNEEMKAFSGSWEIMASFKFLFFFRKDYTNTGTWKMYKDSPSNEN